MFFCHSNKRRRFFLLKHHFTTITINLGGGGGLIGGSVTSLTDGLGGNQTAGINNIIKIVILKTLSSIMRW